MLEEFFGLSSASSEVHMFKSLMARYYRPCYQRLLDKILAGPVLHVDETEVKLRTGKGYVWVFATAEEVVYLYRPTREGDFLPELLKDFRGVLVSDFYAAYDALDVPAAEVPDPPDPGHEPGPAEQPVRRGTPVDHRPVRDAPAGGRRGRSTGTGSSARHLGQARAGRGPILRRPGGAVVPVGGRRGPAGAAAEVPGQAVHVPPARRGAVEQQQRRERDQAVRLLPGGHSRAA